MATAPVVPASKEMALASFDHSQVPRLIIGRFGASGVAFLDALRAHMAPGEAHGHGYAHVLAVAGLGLDGARDLGLDDTRTLLVVLACLLHDADDPKLRPRAKADAALAVLAGGKPDAALAPDAAPTVAQALLAALGVAPEPVLQMIGWTSARINRNTIPVADAERWRLLPRDADRLEAVGYPGVLRCAAYARHIGNPVHVPGATKVALTPAEVWAAATPERYAAYAGKSASEIDHYYDKLLRCAEIASGSAYLARLARDRVDLMVGYVVNYWNALPPHAR